MKIMLDCSQEKIRDYSERYGTEYWQLRTPLTRYTIGDIPYGLDNGCFTHFKQKTWERMLRECISIKMPQFVALPDMVGDATRTLDLFTAFEKHTSGLPRALVLQDGIGKHRIPWDKIAAVFIGGTDGFKISQEAFSAARSGKILQKWVHVGRINTVERMEDWLDLADSIDGSGVSRFDYVLENLLRFLEGDHPRSKQKGLFDGEPRTNAASSQSGEPADPVR